jgi:hypothetical protein
MIGDGAVDEAGVEFFESEDVARSIEGGAAFDRVGEILLCFTLELLLAPGVRLDA